MAAAAQDLWQTPRPVTWLWEFLKHELAPYPGRAAAVARMVLAATLVMILCNTFRIPYAFLGGIYALLISRESPRATVRSAANILLLTAAGVSYILVSVECVISVPFLHLLWNLGSFFLAFYVLSAITNYGAFVGFAMTISISVTIWDRHMPAEANVEDTLWLSGVAVLAAAVTSGVEILCRRARPGDEIVIPVTDRLAALHSVLICYSERRPVDQSTEEKIIRLGMVGTSTIRSVLLRSNYSHEYRAQMGGVVALTGRLVDIATALTQLSSDPSSFDREHLRKLAAAVASLRADLVSRRIPGLIQTRAENDQHRVPLLLEMENTIALIPLVFAGNQAIDEYGSDSQQISRSTLLATGAFGNPERLRFALKGWFAVCVCYVIYNAIDWRGMGVPIMLTCFLTAFSTIGTSRQRQVLRFAGFVAGGLLIGMTSQMFLLPNLDSITAFTVFFMLVTALAAWFMTSSPRLSFFGLQFAAMFFVINMQKFARETSLAVARDRVAGVFLGLLVMWLVFDQLWSAPASVEIKKVFASNMRLLAKLTREPVSSDFRSATERISALHDTINSNFDKVRALADGVLLEFGSSRRQDLILRERIRRWQPQLRALFLMRVASLKYRLQLSGFALPQAVLGSLEIYDECSARLLESIADRMEGKESLAGVSAEASGVLEQTLGSCRANQSLLLLSARGATLVPLLGEIDKVTSRLAGEVTFDLAGSTAGRQQ